MGQLFPSLSVSPFFFLLCFLCKFGLFSLRGLSLFPPSLLSLIYSAAIYPSLTGFTFVVSVLGGVGFPAGSLLRGGGLGLGAGF